MPKQYSEEFRKAAVQRFEASEALSDICTELHIAPSTMYNWIKLYRSIDSDCHSYSLREFDAMSRRLTKVEHQLKIIRQTEIISKAPLQDRLCILAKMHEESSDYSVHELCDALEVSRGTFYNHIFRRADRSKYMDEQAELMLKVQQIFDDNEQRIGAEKIRVILAASGIHVSAKRVREIMLEMGLQSVRSDAKNTKKE